VTRILVVGAGIGGLTLASALTRLAPDVRIEVVERDRDVLSRAQGYSVGLRRGEGMAVLRRLGLEAAVERVSRPVPELRLLSPRGRTLRSFKPAGPDSEHALTAVPRARLRELLLETLPPGAVSWNARAVGFGQEGERATVRLQDGSSRTADVLVACDGARSPARLQVFGKRLRYVGLSRIGGLAERLEDPRLARGPFMTLGTAVSAFVHPLAHERLVWSVALRTTEDELAGVSPADLLARAATATRGWHEPIPTLVASTDEADIDVRGLYDVEPPARALEGRILLLGDASHAMTPYRGRGANMAMLDALELAEALSAQERVDTALRLFEQRMLPRNRRAVSASHAASQSLHPGSTFGAVVRNARLAAVRFRRS
jgi:2-polyprenyl-6-methoxyphenol hydroxylase-like FAD-dependent oxidoreductase